MIIIINNNLIGGIMNTYKRLLKYTPEKNHYAYISIFLSVLASITAVMPYWFFWKFLNEFIIRGNAVKSKTYAIIIVGLMIAYGFIYILAVMMSHLLGFRLETNLRKEGAKNLLKASFSFFDENSSGKIKRIIDDNAVETHSIVAHLIPDNASVIVTPLLLVAMTFYIDIRLGILMLLVILVSGITIKAMMGNKEFMRLYTESLERLNSESIEYVRGMQVVKIFKGTVQSFKAFYKAIVDYSKYVLNYSLSTRTPYVLFQILLNIFVAFTVPFSVIFINRGEDPRLILCKIVYCAVVSGILNLTFTKVMYVGMNGFLGVQAVEKLENLFTEMSKDKVRYGTLEDFSNFNIEFKNVSFKYSEDYILENISFKLKEKQTYALVGKSGSGKSTIAKLISGFYKVNEGSVLIGGNDISTYSEKALSENIAFVFQNTKLFKVSIFENVKMGKENASYEEVMDAMEKANCNDIINKFKSRENTVIGSKGVHLSGGEIQRIAIARAILKNANIVILDEASAAADPENEYEIQRAFSNLMKDKTVIMIAHRLSSIKNVDEILVIEDGDIIERGKDRELMNLEGKYKYFQDIFSKANDWRIYGR